MNIFRRGGTLDPAGLTGSSSGLRAAVKDIRFRFVLFAEWSSCLSVSERGTGSRILRKTVWDRYRIEHKVFKIPIIPNFRIHARGIFKIFAKFRKFCQFLRGFEEFFDLGTDFGIDFRVSASLWREEMSRSFSFYGSPASMVFAKKKFSGSYTKGDSARTFRK